MNIERMFNEFQERPIRSGVSEMAEEYMQMEHEKRMTRRDKARKKFAAKFKLE